MDKLSPKFSKSINKDDKFTKIPNRFIDSVVYDAYDKAIFLIIFRFNPSHPSFEHIMKLSGLSRDRVNKSIRKLEKNNIIKIQKEDGKVNWYRSNLTSL